MGQLCDCAGLGIAVNVLPPTPLLLQVRSRRQEGGPTHSAGQAGACPGVECFGQGEAEGGFQSFQLYDLDMLAQAAGVQGRAAGAGGAAASTVAAEARQARARAEEDSSAAMQEHYMPMVGHWVGENG